MADERGEYQKLKDINDLQRDRSAIELDLLKSARDYLALQKEQEGIDKKLLKDLRDRYEEFQRLGRLRLAQEKEIFDTSENYKKASLEEKSRFDTILQTQTNQLNVYKQQQEAAENKLNETKGDVAIQQKALAQEQLRLEKAQDYFGKLGDIFKMQTKNYKILRDTGIVSTKNLVVASSLAAVFEYTLTKFLEFDEVMAKFRVDMGLLRTDSERVSKDIKSVYVNLVGIGVTIKTAVAAATALANEFGGTMKVSRDLIDTTATLKAQLGVAEESSAGFLRNIGALSKTTAQASRYMAYVASALSAAAGVPLNMVMQDVAKLSGAALTMVSRMPGQLVKAAVEARVLGTTLNKMADASRHILNFTESVQQEMDASVLIGQNINLQLARELAYRRDIVGSTKEILRIAKQIDFENLDTFQMEAFAAASGRSTDELLKMIQAQRQLQEAKGIEGLKDEVAAYEKLKNLREGELKDVGFQREQTVKQMANQERIVALQQQWNKLLLEATVILFPVFDFVLRIATQMVKMGPVLSILISSLIKVFNVSEKLGEIFSKFRFAFPFLKVIPYIGWVITAFQLISSLIENIGKVARGEINIWQAMGNIFFDVLLKPFKDVYDWVVKKLGFGSPSEMMWSVIKGVIAGQSYLFDALTSPFRRFLAWIADKIPFLGKSVGEKLRGGMEGALQNTGILEKKVITPITPIGIKTELPITTKTSEPTAIDTTTGEGKQKEKDSTTLSSVLDALKQLNADLISGKVAVYLDGQLVSSVIARGTHYAGGYGTNNVRV